MRIARLSVKRPVATLMVYVSLLILGAIAIYRIPLAFLPTLDWPEMWIWIPYPNSSPLYIEKNIVKPAEEMLSTLSGLKKMRATADADSAQIQLTFDWGKKLDTVRVQVDEKLDIAKRNMPADLENIFVFNFNTTDIPVVQARISAFGADLSKNYDLLDKRIANRIRRIPGVAKVELNGVQAKEINIYLILDKIKEHNVDVGRLVQRLQNANAQMSIGRVSENRLHYNVRVLGNFDAIDLIKSFQVNDRGLQLKDVATITYEEPVLTFGRHLNRQSAVALEVFKESSANTVDVARRVLDVIKNDIGKDPLLKGMDLFIWNDQAKEITDSVNGIRNSGIIGGFLAFLILYFFLRRWDATSIISLSIPLSLVVASVVLFIMGKSFNILSMMGLMLGVGMLVDNAIVVLEAIYRKYQVSGDAVESSIIGTKEVGMAVTCSTLTTIIVFFPLIIGGRDELSIWLKEVGISISITLLCSLFVSLTLIPLAASRILTRKVKKENRFISYLQERYVDAITWTMRHRISMFFIIIGVLVIGIFPFAMGWIDAKPFSGGIKQNRLGIRYEFFDYFYKSQVEDYVNTMEDYLFSHEKEFNIKSVYSTFSDNDAMSVLTFSKDDLSEDDVKKIRNTIRDGHPVLPGAKIGFWGDAHDAESPVQSINVNLFGDRTEYLSTLADEAVRRVSQLEGMEDVRSSILSGKNEVRVSLNKELASKYGLSPQELSMIFYFTLGGQKLRKFNAGDKEVDVYISLDRADRENIEDLKKLVVVGSAGRGVPLGDLAVFSIVPRAERIERENRKTSVTVSATYEGKNFKKAQADLRRIFDSMDFPSGYTWSFGEEMIREQEQTRQMIVNLLLALALIYIVMASLFESLAHPFSIVFSIPFALPGISWLLLATGTPFNLMAWIGMLILMGIVVNNGIVLIDKVNQLRREGVARDEAIAIAGRERLRPIMMTALTTILGILPMALGSSSVGDAYYYPMARTIMGGLTASTFLTLLILPYIYTIFDEIAQWARRVVALSRGSSKRIATYSPAVPSPEE